MTILETRNLTKHYGSRRVLHDVSLKMQKGSVYGLLGPNGAGKTTLLRVINNIIVSDSGEVLLNGKPMSRELGRGLGYMPEERGLYSKMQVEEQILYFGQLKGGDKHRLTQVMHHYMDAFSIARADRKRKVQELSKGNQQKVQIIATLVHEPELVMLDEPFSGFDPINGALLTALIEELKNQGTTIVLSSHNMAAVEEMCSHMALINSGRLLVHGAIRDIKEANRENIVHIKSSENVDFSRLEAEGIITGIHEQRDADGNMDYQISMKDNNSGNELALEVCRQANLVKFEEKLPSLSELFIKYTELGAQSTPIAIEEFEKIN